MTFGIDSKCGASIFVLHKTMAESATRLSGQAGKQKELVNGQ